MEQKIYEVSYENIKIEKDKVFASSEEEAIKRVKQERKRFGDKTRNYKAKRIR